VGVTHQRVVHHIVDAIDPPRIQADESRRELGDPGANTPCMGGYVVRAKGSAFTPSLESGVRLDADDRCVETAILASSRQPINPAGEGQADLENTDRGYPHEDGFRRSRLTG
jgi:hypothetical protein